MPRRNSLTGRKEAQLKHIYYVARSSHGSGGCSLDSQAFSAASGHGVAAAAAPNGGIAGFSASGFAYIPDEHGGGAIPADP